MIVWGGERDDTGRGHLADGAAFDPATDTWRPIADSPLSARVYPEAVWTGSEMVVAGGIGPLEAAAYDPAADTWRLLAPPPMAVSPPFGGDSTGYVGSVWSGEEFVIWSVGGGVLLAYDPADDQWRSMEPPPLEGEQGALRWDGEQLHAVGITVSGLTVATLVGETWEVGPGVDLSGGTYLAAPVPHLSAMVNRRMVAWSDSGVDGRTVAFNPTGGTWSDDIAAVPAHGCEGVPEPFVLDDRVFAPAWCGPAHLYDAPSDTWSEISIHGTGSRRYSVWTGEEILTWGDTCCYGAGAGPFTEVKAWRYRPPPR